MHCRGFAAHRDGLPWHVTLATSDAVVTVTRRSRRTWVLTNFARLPGGAHRGAGAPLLRQVLTAASTAGAAVQLTASGDELLAYYRRHGFTPAPGARSARRLTRPG